MLQCGKGGSAMRCGQMSGQRRDLRALWANIIATEARLVYFPRDAGAVILCRSRV
jgi:hypothetical protein